jgi:[ribosomal protein S5]-alanine N-acetyltransferase
MEIQTDRLLLRPPDLDRDLEDVVLGASDSEVPRFIVLMPSPYGIDDARTWFEDARRGWLYSDVRTFVICDQRTEEFFGVVTVHLHEGGRVGYWLKRDARGQGVMTEAVRAIVGWAQDDHSISHLILTTDPANIASQRVAERAGFRRVGVAAHDPPLADGRTESILFELRQREFGEHS